jgi:hypothetical protein
LLRRASGERQPITNIQVVRETHVTYNFEVADNHNYFVGEQGLLVHNDCYDLAVAAQKSAGGGSVVRVTQTNPATGNQTRMLQLPRGMYGDQAWFDHYVHINKGMVTDKLSKYKDTPVPFNEWRKNWDTDVTNFTKAKERK